METIIMASISVSTGAPPRVSLTEFEAPGALQPTLGQRWSGQPIKSRLPPDGEVGPRARVQPYDHSVARLRPDQHLEPPESLTQFADELLKLSQQHAD